jgi:hypothetical protein
VVIEIDDILRDEIRGAQGRQEMRNLEDEDGAVALS